MKLSIKQRFLNFKNLKKQEKIEQIFKIICFIVGITIGVIFFISIDKVSATSDDYEELEEQLVNIKENPELLFEMDCDVNVGKDNIIVTLENDECKLIKTYDKGFEVLSTCKEDTYLPWHFALVASIIIGLLLGIILPGVITIAIVAVIAAILWVFTILVEFVFNKLILFLKFKK